MQIPKGKSFRTTGSATNRNLDQSQFNIKVNGGVFCGYGIEPQNISVKFRSLKIEIDNKPYLMRVICAFGSSEVLIFKFNGQTDHKFQIKGLPYKESVKVKDEFISQNQMIYLTIKKDVIFKMVCQQLKEHGIDVLLPTVPDMKRLVGLATIMIPTTPSEAIKPNVFYDKHAVGEFDLKSKKRKTTHSLPAKKSSIVDMTDVSNDDPFGAASFNEQHQRNSALFENKNIDIDLSEDLPETPTKNTAYFKASTANYTHTFEPISTPKRPPPQIFNIYPTSSRGKTLIPSLPIKLKEARIDYPDFQPTLDLSLSNNKKSLDVDDKLDFAALHTSRKERRESSLQKLKDKHQLGTTDTKNNDTPRTKRQSLRIAKRESNQLYDAPTNYQLVSMPSFLRKIKANTIICENGVQLKKEDAECLDTGQFLNDQVILYFITHFSALKRESRVHIFSSFFFTKLKSLIKEKSDLAPLKRWHKKVDLLDRPIIILPINENYHWYFAIIIGLPKVKAAIEAKIEPTELGYIVQMDSLMSSVRGYMKRPIVKYLSLLLDQPEDIINKFIKLKVGNSPIQPNGCDCGLFVIHSISKILDNEQVIDKIISTKDDWWGTIVDRQALLTIIDDDHTSYQQFHPQIEKEDTSDLDGIEIIDQVHKLQEESTDIINV